MNGHQPKAYGPFDPYSMVPPKGGSGIALPPETTEIRLLREILAELRHIREHVYGLEAVLDLGRDPASTDTKPKAKCSNCFTEYYQDAMEQDEDTGTFKCGCD